MEGKLIKTDGTYLLSVNEYKDEVFAIADINKAHELDKHKLSLKNCEAIENGYDLNELGFNYAEQQTNIGHTWWMYNKHFQAGFQKALSILGDKKFSEDDLDNFRKFQIQEQNFSKSCLDVWLKSLQQTEFDVEIETIQYGLGNDEDGRPVFETRNILDADGCLILKRK